MYTWSILVICLVATAHCASVRKLAPLLAEDSPTAIRDEYIVVFNDDVSDETVNRHHYQLSTMTGPGLQERAHEEVTARYHIGSFRGYSLILSNENVLEQIRSMEEVKYIERNQIYEVDDNEPAACATEAGATWGLVRTTQRDLNLRADYEYDPNGGEGVDVYILDTGIETTHPDFEGRAEWGIDTTGNPGRETDGHGHGTHCAGTVISKTWGLARKATAIAVKVLSDSGSGSTAGIIDGVNWVAAERERKKKKSVANMSLGGGVSESFNNAVNAAVAAGVHFSVSAGNDYGDACRKSPASAEEPVTVGASDKNDQKSSFSNTGTCVDIFAPGTDVTSTWIGGGTNTISGTSMAAPHVAGVIANILATNDYTPAEMKARLKEESTKGALSGIPGDTYNELVYYRYDQCPPEQ